MSRRHLALALLPALFVIGSLTACDPVSPSDDAGSDGTSTTDGEVTTDDGSESSTGVTVSGDGSYTIPDQIPYGGYQLVGDPGVLPDGCTWSITGEDGEVVAESQGAYVFITDIDEASTFTTAGCPEWEQFE